MVAGLRTPGSIHQWGSRREEKERARAFLAPSAEPLFTERMSGYRSLFNRKQMHRDAEVQRQPLDLVRNYGVVALACLVFDGQPPQARAFRSLGTRRLLPHLSLFNKMWRDSRPSLCTLLTRVLPPLPFFPSFLVPSLYFYIYYKGQKNKSMRRTQ